MVGKIIGALIGYFAQGFFGAVMGLIAGHFFDRGLRGALRFDSAGERARLQQLFFETTFRVMGHLAKADGRISEAEIAHSEAVMAQMGLSAEHRREAIALFKQGAQADFQLEQAISSFIVGGGRQRHLPLLLLEYLIAIALADDELHDAEREVLLRCGQYLGVPAPQLQQLLAMLSAQQQFGAGAQRRSGKQASGDELAAAYQALGVGAQVSDSELKRAYRKLISQHHPDKLIAQGVPDDMVKLATEKTQQIQAAYERVKAHRGKN